MNKKGYFFFLEWGKDNKQEQISGIKLGKCNCGEETFNAIYNLSRSHLFWIIPLGSWKIENVFIQCSKCGAIYGIDGKLEKEAREFYEKVKGRRDVNENEDKKEIKAPTLKEKKKSKSKIKPTWLGNFKGDIKGLVKKK